MQPTHPPQVPPSQPARPECWPYIDTTGRLPLPATMPDGRPWPKISVVTPSFNQGKYIEQTILSVLNQNYPNVEHIVMDGGSKDETLSVLDQYRDRLAHAVSEKDRGQSHAINKGMALATGQILTWINSDDMLAPGALAAAAMAFHTSNADMIAGICRLYRDGQYIGGHVTSCADGQPLPIHELLDLDHCWNVGQFFYQPETLFTRDLWQRAGGRVEESLYYSMDYDLWLRFARAGARLHVIGRPIAHFRVHEDQKTYSPQKFITELTAARDKFAQDNGITRAAPNPRSGAKPSLRVTIGGPVSPAARAMAVAGYQVTVLTSGAATAAADLDATAAASGVVAVSTDEFRPVEKYTARHLLGLPGEGFLVLTTTPLAAQTTAALAKLGLPAPQVLAGHEDPLRRALLLSAADVFVADAPAPLAESAACGTPTVSPTALDGLTGRLVKDPTADSLATAIQHLHANPTLRSNLGAWARLHAENEWSLVTAAHRIHNALTASGAADRLPLSRKISLPPAPQPITELNQPTAPQPAQPAAAVTEEFNLLTGFGPWQAPDSKKNLPRCCWALGPSGKVQVSTARPGRRRLVIACHNYESGQRLQVLLAGQILADSKLPLTAGKPEHTLDIPLDLPAGATQLELRYGKWSAPAANRPARAILITRISCDPVA